MLGCLTEKKELTPDIYPLTLNAALAAANQKTAREPVMSLELVEVRRALGQLEQKGLVGRSLLRASSATSICSRSAFR